MSATSGKKTGKAALRAARAGVSALLLAAAALLGAQEQGGVAEDGEPLAAGQARERAITGEERHAYRVEVAADLPVLVQVEQLGVSLVVETEGPAGRLATGGSLSRRGVLILLLE